MELTERFEEALVFATQRHRGQRRKGTPVPYVSHLMQVAGLVLEYGGDEDQAIGALLHDVVEDRKATLDEVRERFGSQVAAIVWGCTDTETKSGEKEPWWDRKRQYVQRIADEPETVLLVSAADKVHNARAILADYRERGDALFESFQADKAATLWYYGALVDAFIRKGTSPRLVGELRRTVAELNRLVYGEA